MLVLTGVNLIFSLAPFPEMSRAANDFLSALVASHYVLPLSGIIALFSGLTFISNKYVAKGALLLLPITVNIVAFHLFLDFASGLGAYVFFVLNIYIIWVNKDRYSELRKA